VVSVIGASLSPEPAISKGLTIERSYYTLDGKPVDLASANGGKGELMQNDRLVTVLKIGSDEASGRVLLVDHLPAGLEIENPHLVDSGDIKTLDWLKSTLRPEHTEFRDDRFVASFNLWARPASSDSENDGNSGSDQSTNDDSSSGDDADVDVGKVLRDKLTAAGATVAYVVRVVTPGTYVHPAATVEDMYRPERYARSGAGELTVKAKD
jgi:uncharacterized protein YfaS (alpha-2-macroglobulin family)